jgi:hypothetical protein
MALGLAGDDMLLRQAVLKGLLAKMGQRRPLGARPTGGTPSIAALQPNMRATMAQQTGRSYGPRPVSMQAALGQQQRRFVR